MCELQPPDLSFYIGILAGLLAIVTPIYQFFEKEEQDRTFIKNGSQFIVALAGMLAITITIIQWNDKRNEDYKHCLSEQKAMKDKAKADSLQLEIYKIGKKNSDDLFQASNNLHESDREIIRLNNEIRYHETGTKSYPTLKIKNEKVFIVNFGKYGNSVDFIIENNSKFPVNTLKYWMNDSNDKMRIGKDIMKAVGRGDSNSFMNLNEKFIKMKYIYENDIGTLNDGEKYVLRSVKMFDFPANRFLQETNDDNKNNYLYNIQMRWKGGILYYLINLTVKNQTIIVSGLEISFNGKKIKDNSRFFKLENVQ